MSVYTTRLKTAFSNREFYKIIFPTGEIKWLPRAGFDCRILATFLRMCWRKNSKNFKLCKLRQKLWIEFKRKQGGWGIWTPDLNKHPPKKDVYYKKSCIDQDSVDSVSYKTLIKFIEAQN